MLEYTWRPRKTLINSGSNITIKDLEQKIVTPPQAPEINGRDVTIYVPKEGRYFVTIKSQTISTTHRVDVNDTANDTGPGITSPLVDPQRPGTFLLGGERILGETALNAKYAGIVRTSRQRPSNTMVLFGDSITAYNGGTSTATPTQPLTADFNSKGMHRWANVMLNKDLNIIGNSGIAGQETGQMTLRFKTDVLDLNPAIVSILAGTNDDGPEDATIANLQTMYEQALGAGILVLAHTIPPSTAATLESYRLKVTNWIRNYCRTTPGMILADIAAAWQDTTQTGFKAIATMLHDGVHPNTAGAMSAGRVIADALRPFVPRNRTRPDPAGAPYNLLANPHFTGTGTATPTGWGLTGTPTISYLPRDDGFSGQKIQFIAADETSFTIQQNVTIDGTLLAVGDSIDFGISFEVENLDTTSTLSQRAVAYLQHYNGSTFSNKRYDMYVDGAADYGSARYPLTEGTFRTPALTVVTGMTLVQCVITFQGGGTYRLKGASLRNLTKIASA